MTALNNNVQVDLPELRGHAATVQQLATELSSVAGGLPGGPADNALGTFVQSLTAGLREATTRVTDSIAGAASAVDSVGTGLAQTADGYQHTDDHSAGRLRWEEVR